MSLNNSQFNGPSPSTDTLDLIGVRRLFVEITGRVDLIVDGNTDLCVNAGADQYIRAGQQYLDERGLGPATKARMYVALTSGDFFALVNLISLESVQFVTATSRNDISKNKVTEAQLLAEGPTSLWTIGTPKVWSYITSRLAPGNSGSSSTIFTNAGIVDFEPVQFTQIGSIPGIMWKAPVDQDTTLELIGHFYSAYLSEDTDQSWWTINKKFILACAAALQMEKTARNRQGMMDWLATINEELQELDNGMVEQEVESGNIDHVY